MQTTFIGAKAETAATKYLQKLGYEVVDRNWRRKDCEIDIVARKDNCLYFVEVKYRRTIRAGSGLDHITEQKVRRMQYAAYRYVAESSWYGEFVLKGIEVSGQHYSVTGFVEIW